MPRVATQPSKRRRTGPLTSALSRVGGSGPTGHNPNALAGAVRNAMQRTGNSFGAGGTDQNTVICTITNPVQGLSAVQAGQIKGSDIIDLAYQLRLIKDVSAHTATDCLQKIQAAASGNLSPLSEDDLEEEHMAWARKNKRKGNVNNTMKEMREGEQELARTKKQMVDYERAKQDRLQLLAQHRQQQHSKTQALVSERIKLIPVKRSILTPVKEAQFVGGETAQPQTPEAPTQNSGNPAKENENEPARHGTDGNGSHQPGATTTDGGDYENDAGKGDLSAESKQETAQERVLRLAESAIHIQAELEEAKAENRRQSVLTKLGELHLTPELAEQIHGILDAERKNVCTAAGRETIDGKAALSPVLQESAETLDGVEKLLSRHGIKGDNQEASHD